jgi:hypothetical protein
MPKKKIHRVYFTSLIWISGAARNRLPPPELFKKKGAEDLFSEPHSVIADISLEERIYFRSSCDAHYDDACAAFFSFRRLSTRRNIRKPKFGALNVHAPDLTGSGKAGNCCVAPAKQVAYLFARGSEISDYVLTMCVLCTSCFMGDLGSVRHAIRSYSL